MMRALLSLTALTLAVSACQGPDPTPSAAATQTEGTTGVPDSSTSVVGADTTAPGTSTAATETASTTDAADAAGESSSSDSGDRPTTTGSLDPATVLFEEDFESAPPGTTPQGWDSFVGYVVNMNNEPTGQAFALADDTRARNGSQALHVRGGSTPAMLTRPLPPGVDRIYVRAYVWLTAQLGQNPGNNHETLLGVRGSVGQANEEVRFGEIKGAIGTNEVPSDDISPTMDQWGRGPLVQAGQWNCIEVAFVATPGAHEVRAWRDGDEIHHVNDPSQWNNGALDSDFLTGKFNEFIIGWHSFSNVENELWVDDLIVATERVGC